ncbi:uncharacterized protein SRS1_25019 [Sporisorium reilianum f. sp. reilianum]|uniref:Uncharacterized protein n=1 Tax=Sporisorium reilianum f. sp. reilianum TaxID=72559 RepID=A0A2N8UP34_9BASI|nr:uncharacterized protein SRS1_25019 [Sporisorium reilianum f. sp. reilianum]
MHSQGNSYLGFSHDTKGQNREKATELLNWAKQHSNKYLLTLKTLLPAEWRDDMESRKAPKEWLKGYFDRQVELVNAWWMTTTFFDRFTGTPHKDPDHQPSFLFNFGAPCYLVLHNYNIKIKLDHLNVAIFNTNTLEHSTQAVDGGEDTRWAFSAFFRKGIYEKKGPSQLGKDLLDRVLGPEQPLKRV